MPKLSVGQGLNNLCLFSLNPLLMFMSCNFVSSYLSSDSEMLRYAYAEVEESRGAIQVWRVQHLFDMLNSFVLGL